MIFFVQLEIKNDGTGQALIFSSLYRPKNETAETTGDDNMESLHLKTYK